MVWYLKHLLLMLAVCLPLVATAQNQAQVDALATDVDEKVGKLLETVENLEYMEPGLTTDEIVACNDLDNAAESILNSANTLVTLSQLYAAMVDATDKQNLIIAVKRSVKFTVTQGDLARRAINLDMSQIHNHAALAGAQELRDEVQRLVGTVATFQKQYNISERLQQHNG